MKYPPDGLRYGSPRDLELTRRDEERCEKFWAWIKSFGALLIGWGGLK